MLPSHLVNPGLTQKRRRSYCSHRDYNDRADVGIRASIWYRAFTLWYSKYSLATRIIMNRVVFKDERPGHRARNAHCSCTVMVRPRVSANEKSTLYSASESLAIV